MDYRIGLDIGTTSVGWAVVENDSMGKPKRIVDLGVRIFDAAEHPKDGSSLALPRREARGARRRIRRRKHRKERIKVLLEANHLIHLDDFMEKYQSGKLTDVYKLRYEALERVLSGEELAQVLLHIAKHRGFQSNRRAELKDDEGGKVLTAVSENEKCMKENGYRTIGEMLYLDKRFKMSTYGESDDMILCTRNHGGNYHHTINRSMLIEEVNFIFDKQRELGSSIADETFQAEYLKIMLGQRSFDQGPGNPSAYAGNLIEKMIGRCTFEQKEYRAAKACYTSQLFVLLQKLNHLRVKSAKGEELHLEEHFAEIAEKAFIKRKVTYADLRKELKLSLEHRFSGLNYSDKEKSIEESIKKAEKAIFIELKYFHEIREALDNYDLSLLRNVDFVEYLDDIGTILTLYKSDDIRIQRLSELEVPKEQIEKLLELSPAKFQHLSLKAMKKINPYLEQGNTTYNEACEAAGYDFRAKRQGEKFHFLKGTEINTIINEIPNPVVKRSISQTFKVVNAIIREYGSPQSVHIELARDISRNFEDRKKREKEIEDNQKSNERTLKHLSELGFQNLKGKDILKYKLWQEQGECCLYSGKRISIDKLFLDGYAEVDHIIPFSKSFDNSYNNKVLVLKEENQNKGNRIPYEAFGENKVKWEGFQQRVELYVKNYNKKNRLLKQELTDDDIRAGKTRHLNDTSYITRFVHGILVDYLEFAPYADNKIRKVFAVNGRITSFLRVRWGIQEKDRSTDTHHAVDALIIACCTQKMVNKIARNLQAKEIGSHQLLCLRDEETGEEYFRRDYSDEAWIQKFGKKLPLPWNWFLDELMFRLSPDPQEKYDRFEYPEEAEEKIKPIFVSRMPRHKVTGQMRADTIRSPRHFEEEGIVVSKVPLTSLKLDKDGEISNFYDKDSDKLLYNALKAQLAAYHNDPKKAFEEDFYKPKADGTKGPLVRKVKVWDSMTVGVYVNNNKGIAANGSMVRVDVFCENGKYYFVPIYVTDTKKKELPNKAVVGGKSYSKWKNVKDEDFLFSLYPNDLFFFKHSKGMKAKTNKNEPCVINEQVCYFKGADISTASFSGILHDSSAAFRSMGIQNLLSLQKWQVDILGNISEVKKEKRMYFQS